MNKNLLAIALVLPLLMTAAASAQTVHMRVNVPFKFIVAGATLPAGVYDIQSFGVEEKLLAIRSMQSSHATLAFSGSCESLNPSSRTKLVFHRYGDRYFLSELWVEGLKTGHQVTPASREVEVALDYPQDRVELLLARR